MAGGIPSTGSSSVSTGSESQGNYKFALILMVSLFFVIGFITVLNDVLLPRLKGLFDLSNRDAMLIMFCVFWRLFGLGVSRGHHNQNYRLQKGDYSCALNYGVGLVFVCSCGTLGGIPRFSISAICYRFRFGYIAGVY